MLPNEGRKNLSEALMVLVHSPLCGPSTYAGLAPELASRHWSVSVPDLIDNGRPPYQQQQAASAAAAISGDGPVILVGHSGAGALLPAIGAELEGRVAAYLFLDAGLPGRDGMTRFDVMAQESPSAVLIAAALRAQLANGGRFPNWSVEDLRGLVPNPKSFLRDLRPRGIDYFAEPLSVPPAWPEVPVGYVLLSKAYDEVAMLAEANGWPVERTINSGHFHLLMHPPAVADALEAVLRTLGAD